MLKVRITKASKPTYWYADKIGETFEVENAVYTDALGDFYSTPEEHGAIDKADCEVLDGSN